MWLLIGANFEIVQYKVVCIFATVRKLRINETDIYFRISDRQGRLRLHTSAPVLLVIDQCIYTSSNLRTQSLSSILL